MTPPRTVFGLRTTPRTAGSSFSVRDAMVTPQAEPAAWEAPVPRPKQSLALVLRQAGDSGNASTLSIEGGSRTSRGLTAMQRGGLPAEWSTSPETAHALKPRSSTLTVTPSTASLYVRKVQTPTHSTGPLHKCPSRTKTCSAGASVSMTTASDMPRHCSDRSRSYAVICLPFSLETYVSSATCLAA